MALIKSDNFSSANDGWELNFIGWTKHPNYGRLYVVGGGKQVAAYTVAGCHYWPTAPASADQRHAADLIIGDYGNEAGKVGWVAVRLQSDANTMYRAGKIDGFWRIEKVVNGVVTVIGTSVQQYVHNVTQRVTLEAVDNGSGGVDLKLYRNAETTPIVSGTDSTSPIMSIGYIGIGLSTDGYIKIDNVYAETIESNTLLTPVNSQIAVSSSLGAVSQEVVNLLTPVSSVIALQASLGTLQQTHAITPVSSQLAVQSSRGIVVSTAGGIIHIPPFHDWETGLPRDGLVFQADVRNIATGALVVRLTGLVTTPTGCDISDPLIEPSTEYEVVTRGVDGSLGIWDYTSS